MSGQFTPVDPPPTWKKVELTRNSRTVLEKRYLRKGPDLKPIETPEQMFYRIALAIASVESTPEEVQSWTKIYYDMLVDKDFFPNTPTFTGAGTPLGQLAACFVLPIKDDLGRDPDGIFSSLRNAALIQQTGGGNGFSFSRLREKGAFVATSGGVSSGPIGFLEVFDKSFGMIAQGGSRRGANMAVLSDDHPDIMEFIACKSEEGNITNFNISVAIHDRFVEAVRKGENYDLISPHTGKVIRSVPASEIFDAIVRRAHSNGEPGVLFIDTANRQNPVPHLYTLESTNPCGEQWLGPYENCCLGSVNLVNHVNADGTINWLKLANTVSVSTRFLDSVVTVNTYVAAISQLKEAALRARRIGLGFMGMADLLIACRTRYGGEDGLELASQVTEFIRYHCMNTSIQLAREKGPFNAISGSIYDPRNFTWEIPTPLPGIVHRTNYGRPHIDWNALKLSAIKFGIRNAAQTTVAPTGTIATVAGCEGYGCEPVFALCYIRNMNDGDKIVQLEYSSPDFVNALKKFGYSEAQMADIISQVMKSGSCQQVQGLDKSIKHSFVVSGDLTGKEHVRMQAAMQAFVDNAMSKTCNLPYSATEQDVRDCYLLAYDLGCKGITIYRTGSREKVVIEVPGHNNVKPAQTNLEHEPLPAPEQPLPPTPKKRKVTYQRAKKPRPHCLKGLTFRVETPLGQSYVTINENPEGEPFEVFVTLGKGGSETAAVTEGFGRLVSLILRMESPISQMEKLRKAAEQLRGIGGRRGKGFGSKQILSVPDAIARALQEYLDERDASIPESPIPLDSIEVDYSQEINSTAKELCPGCKDAGLVPYEGCKRCFICGYQEC